MLLVPLELVFITQVEHLLKSRALAFDCLKEVLDKIKSMKEMNYPNITTRIIYFGFYTSYYSLNINVSYHFQTLFNRFCSFEKELHINR